MGLISRVSSRTYRSKKNKSKSYLIMASAAAQQLPPQLRPDQKQIQQFENSYKQIRKLQEDIKKHVQSRQTLEAQLHENVVAEKEVAFCDRSAVIFKQVGPILVKQELDEVKMNVKKRIDYIKKEMDRHDKQIENCKNQQEEQKKSLRTIEEQLAKQMQSAGLIKKN